jgi:hypothetical protein
MLLFDGRVFRCLNRIHIPARGEELEGTDTDVARRDANSIAPGKGVSRQLFRRLSQQPALGSSGSRALPLPR